MLELYDGLADAAVVSIFTNSNYVKVLTHQGRILSSKSMSSQNIHVYTHDIIPVFPKAVTGANESMYLRFEATFTDFWVE